MLGCLCLLDVGMVPNTIVSCPVLNIMKVSCVFVLGTFKLYMPGLFFMLIDISLQHRLGFFWLLFEGKYPFLFIFALALVAC